MNAPTLFISFPSRIVIANDGVDDGRVCTYAFIGYLHQYMGLLPSTRRYNRHKYTWRRDEIGLIGWHMGSLHGERSVLTTFLSTATTAADVMMTVVSLLN